MWPVGQTGRIADLHLIPTGYERLLPPTVQMTVRSRRRALVHSVTGRVLDLGGAESHRSLWNGADAEVTILDGVADPMLLSLVDRAETFDAIVSVLQLATAPDLPGTLSRLHRLLSPEGTVRFLETGRLVGAVGRAQRLAAPLVTMSTGIRVTRDIPAELRASGLSVTSVERHRTNTAQWWLRVLVEGTAHPALPLA